MINEQLQKKIDRSIKLLQSVAKGYDGEIEVAYSGGKDSDVILQLAKEAGIKFKAIYKNTTIDPPGTIKHAKDMGAEVLRPEKTFFQLIAEHGFPTMQARFCCGYLKEYKTPGFDKVVMGVRKAESVARNKRYEEPTKCLGTKANPREGIFPLLDWEDRDVRDFILDRNIQCHPLYYDECCGHRFHVERRLGCMCCPLQYYKRRIVQFKKYPRMVKAYLRAGQKYRDTHPNSKRVQDHDDVYSWFVRDVFFNNTEDFERSRNGLFGKPDFKEFLERTFGIDLTL